MTLGIDYASVDENAQPDFVKARQAGVRFAYLRRSYAYFDKAHAAHRLAHDSVYARDAHLARAAGVTIGAYLFPSFNKGAPTPVEQVGNFLAAGGEVLPGRDLPVALDVEFPGNGIVDTGRTKTEVYGLVLEFVHALQSHFPAVGIYTSHVQWHDDNGLGRPEVSDDNFKNVVLWLKTPYRLAAGHPPDTTPSRQPHVGSDLTDPHDYWRVPAPWQTRGYWIHQYQGDAKGIAGFNKTTDLNEFSAFTERSTDQVRLAWMTERLGAAGFSGKPWENLRKFQTAKGLQPDGIVGLATFSELAWG